MKSGNTSFTLALPIQWVRNNALGQGSQVSILENEVGQLVLTPERPVEKKETFVTIQVDGKDEEELALELLTAYLRDFSTIVFEGREVRQKTRHILDQLKQYIGLDVIEQTTDGIIIKNFFTVTREDAPRVLLRKLSMGNRAMFELLRGFFRKEFSKEDLSELQRVKQQNDRLFNLVRKTIVKLLEHPALLSRVQTSPLELCKDKVVALAAKNISVSLLVIGKAFVFMDPSKKRQLREMFERVQANHDLVMSLMTHKNPESTRRFLMSSVGEMKRWERIAQSSDDPLVGECANSLVNCNLLLEDIAYQLIE